MNRLAIMLLGLGALGALLWAARPAGGGSSVEGADLARVARRDLSTVVKATGVVRPMIGAEVRVGSRVSGVVRRLHVRLGDVVERGQLLAELDAAELEARRAQAAAALESARASQAYALADLARKRELARGALLAASDLELAERACAVADAQVAEGEANLAYAGTQLEYARIHAPIAGVVASVSTQEGETVAASFASPTFVTLLDLDQLEVWAYVDETDIGRIRPGLAARFTVDTYPDDPFEGRVTTIYPQAEVRDNVVNYVAVVTFAPRQGRVLRPQMTATVRIALEQRSGALAVPRRAIRREGGRTFVLLPAGEGVARREVTTGVKDDTHCEVVSGLDEGDVVLAGEPVDAAEGP